MKYENPIIPYDDMPQYAKVVLEPVEKAYKKVLYINWAIVYTILILITALLFIFIKKMQINWLMAVVALLIISLITITIAAIEIGFKNKAWALREKDIIFKKGWLFQSTHIVPFIKVQHCVMHSGPISRRYGLASIKLMTAASQNIDISINGLKQETAEQLKVFIMEKIEGYEPATN